MSLKRLHSDRLCRAGGTLLRKCQVCEPLFHGLILSLHSITVKSHHFSRLGRYALIIYFCFQGSTVILVRLCSIHTSGSVYSPTIPQVNFIQQPLPKGSKTGAGGKDGVSGALDRGQSASTGLTTFLQFW